MLIRKKRLKRATFNGKYFYLDSNETEVSKKIIKYEYPFRDTPYVEDMGLNTRSWNIEGYVTGPRYKEDRDALAKELEKGEPGKLLHPYLGLLVVRCESYRVHETNHDGGVVKFCIQFCDAGFLDPIVKKKLNLGVQGAATEVKKSLLDSVKNSIGSVSSKFNEEADSVLAMTEKLEDYFSEVAGLRGSFENLATSIRTIKNTVKDFITDEPTKLYGAFLSSLDAILLMAPHFGIASVGLLETLDPALSGSAINPKVALVSTSSQWASKESFKTKAKQDQAKEILLSHINSLLRQENLPLVLYESISILKSDLIKCFQEKERALNLQLFVTEYPTCSLLLSYSKFGNLSREQDILEWNSISHPGFIEPKTKIEVYG